MVPGSDTALEAVAAVAGYKSAASPYPGFYHYSRIPAHLGLSTVRIPLELAAGASPGSSPSTASLW